MDAFQKNLFTEKVEYLGEINIDKNGRFQTNRTKKTKRNVEQIKRENNKINIEINTEIKTNQKNSESKQKQEKSSV